MRLKTGDDKLDWSHSDGSGLVAMRGDAPNNASSDPAGSSTERSEPTPHRVESATSHVPSIGPRRETYSRGSPNVLVPIRAHPISPSTACLSFGSAYGPPDRRDSRPVKSRSLTFPTIGERFPFGPLTKPLDEPCTPSHAASVVNCSARSQSNRAVCVLSAKWNVSGEAVVDPLPGTIEEDAGLELLARPLRGRACGTV